MNSLKEKLLAKTGRTFATVTDGDGDQWTIRSLTELEKSQHDLLAVDRKTGKINWSKTSEAKLRFIAKCLVDPETKEPFISEDEWQKLGEIRSSITSVIYSEALKHNGYEDDEIEERLLGESS